MSKSQEEIFEMKVKRPLVVLSTIFLGLLGSGLIYVLDSTSKTLTDIHVLVLIFSFCVTVYCCIHNLFVIFVDWRTKQGKCSA